MVYLCIYRIAIIKFGEKEKQKIKNNYNYI